MQQQSELLKANRLYRRTHQVHHVRKRQRIKNGRSPPCKNDDRWPAVETPRDQRPNSETLELNYLRISLELLCSMAEDSRLKSVLKKILRQLGDCSDVRKSSQSQRVKQSILSAVFWPGLWQGIWKQFVLDVPRSNVFFNGHVIHDPHLLYYGLEKSLGSLWARWACVFLNQAPMADVLSCVSRDVEIKYGGNVVLCEGTSSQRCKDYFNFNLHVEHGPGMNRLQICMLKNFALRNLATGDLSEDYNQIPEDESCLRIPSTVETKYDITLHGCNAHHSCRSAKLTWNYQK